MRNYRKYLNLVLFVLLIVPISAQLPTNWTQAVGTTANAVGGDIKVTSNTVGSVQRNNIGVNPLTNYKVTITVSADPGITNLSLTANQSVMLGQEIITSPSSTPQEMVLVTTSEVAPSNMMVEISAEFNTSSTLHFYIHDFKVEELQEVVLASNCEPYSIGDYRYAFNGMEKDDELKGANNSYTTKFRQFDPRLGRWLSIDPKASKYASESPYSAFHNSPLFFTDPFGDDPPETTMQDKAREIVANAKFGVPDYDRFLGKYHLQVGYYEDNGSFAISYSGNKKPSKVVKLLLKKVEAQEISIDCQFTTTLIYLATVLETKGEDEFNKMLRREKTKFSDSKYHMFVSPDGLGQGKVDVGLSSEAGEVYERDKQEDAVEAANKAPAGTLVILTAVNKSLVPKAHINEVMMKVETNEECNGGKYVAFDYTSGENAEFYTLEEIMELVKSAGSHFYISAVKEMKFEDIEE